MAKKTSVSPSARRWIALATILCISACTAPLDISESGESPITPGPVPGTPPPAPPPPPTPPPTPPPVVPLAGNSYAFGIWTPDSQDTCTKEIHDSYSTIGPDGKRYPTWHPAVDPATGCTFGHEHGRDPKGSNLAAIVGDIPFGLANEALVDFTGHSPRNEDHVGHKIEWMNGAVFSGTGQQRTCDVLTKIHQGTHSKDAFTNNVHEVAYHLKCDDGAEIHFTSLATIGNGGELLEPCTSIRLLTGSPSPADSPGGIGDRSIPTRECIDEKISGGPRSWVNYGHALTENWAIDPIATMANGNRIAYLAMYFFVSLPSRYFDPALTNGLGRTLDLCYEVDDSKDGRNMGECAQARSDGVVAWNDVNSPFKGTQRTLRWNQPILTNEGGPTVVYTDPFGKNGVLTPFPGSVKQFFAAMSNGGRDVTGPSSGNNYDARGVHAPN